MITNINNFKVSVPNRVRELQNSFGWRNLLLMLN